MASLVVGWLPEGSGSQSRADWAAGDFRGSELEFELPLDDTPQKLPCWGAQRAFVLRVLRYPLPPMLFRTEEVVDPSATAVE